MSRPRTSSGRFRLTSSGPSASPGSRSLTVWYFLVSSAFWRAATASGEKRTCFRPLLCPGDGDLASSAACREDHIEVSPSGLISVTGGKLTTARIMAIRVLDRVIEKIGGATTWSRCSMHRLSIGGTNEAVAEGLAYWVKRYPRLAWYFQILYQRYGLDASTICREAMAIHRWPSTKG